MKLIGCLLLLSGWVVAVAALVMLAAFVQRAIFVAAGAGVEILGLTLLTRAYTAAQQESL